MISTLALDYPTRRTRYHQQNEWCVPVFQRQWQAHTEPDGCEILVWLDADGERAILGATNPAPTAPKLSTESVDKAVDSALYDPALGGVANSADAAVKVASGQKLTQYADFAGYFIRDGESYQKCGAEFADDDDVIALYRGQKPHRIGK